jgi:hypothetical protein
LDEKIRFNGGQERIGIAGQSHLHNVRIILRNISNIPQIHCALGVVVVLGPSVGT